MKRKQTRRSTRNKTPIWIGGVILAVIAVIVGVFVFGQPDQPAGTATYPAEISIDQAAEKREAGAFILDVRQPEEWNEVHIPGATLIPLSELSSRVNEVPKDQEVVVICRSGNRSATGRDILRGAGFDQVTSVAGGMLDWTRMGYPTVSGP